MELVSVRADVLGTSFVMLFQVIGLVGLLVSRLMPGTAWARRGKYVFLFGVLGLGLAGALCGSHHSSAGLMAGGTMTALLIGMNLGTHTAGTAGVSVPERTRIA